MKRVIGNILFLFALILWTISPIQNAWAAESIGQFVVVKGKVALTHQGDPLIQRVKTKDKVFFRDLIMTSEKSKTKVLFLDDSILSLGQNARIEITENVFDPGQDMRSTTIKLLEGKMRILVGKVFSGAGSKFEIHTATAVAVAQGSYAIVWMTEVEGRLATGVANIGDTDWEVWNVEQTIPRPVALGEGITPRGFGSRYQRVQNAPISVTVKPGQFTQVPRGLPPSPPVPSPTDLLQTLQMDTQISHEPDQAATETEEPPGEEISEDEYGEIEVETVGLPRAATPEILGGTIPDVPLAPPIEAQLLPATVIKPIICFPGHVCP